MINPLSLQVDFFISSRRLEDAYRYISIVLCSVHMALIFGSTLMGSIPTKESLSEMMFPWACVQLWWLHAQRSLSAIR
jgi:hypothetical protein